MPDPLHSLRGIRLVPPLESVARTCALTFGFNTYRSRWKQMTQRRRALVLYQCVNYLTGPLAVHRHSHRRTHTLAHIRIEQGKARRRKHRSTATTPAEAAAEVQARILAKLAASGTSTSTNTCAPIHEHMHTLAQVLHAHTDTNTRTHQTGQGTRAEAQVHGDHACRGSRGGSGAHSRETGRLRHPHRQQQHQRPPSLRRSLGRCRSSRSSRLCGSFPARAASGVYF